jgi:tRNA-Thr(GGU) m(6)t(6)A37 methyltransferase TsaA
MKITYRPIGVIHTSFKETAGMPIQPPGAAGVGGTVELRPELAAGLKDLTGFSHILLLYHFHRARDAELEVVPFLDSEPHGVFATRAPNRPNPIGVSIVKLVGVEGHRLRVENVDILDGTPLLDIKPYVPAFDRPVAATAGWLEAVGRQVRKARSDERFR